MSVNKYYDLSVDYFAVLGAHYGACEKTVKMMYRKMARRYHPDVSTIYDAQKKFQEIAFAYEVLKKHRKAYCFDYERHSVNRSKSSGKTANQSNHQSNPQTRSTRKRSKKTKEYSNRAYHSHRPINGKNRTITYPLTLRYAIRLLKLGAFYIPGLKVKMKFTREAFVGKTFRLKGKGYSGLFGGKSGDYLVRFTIKLDSIKFQLEEGDIYGAFFVPKSLIKRGGELKLESPSGSLSVTVPSDYGSSSCREFICIAGRGLPSDGVIKSGDFYVRLVAT